MNRRTAPLLIASATALLLSFVLLLRVLTVTDEHVAVLAEATGNIESAAVSSNAWHTTHTNDRYVMGEAVRTRVNARARIELTAGGSVRMGPDTVVRFGGRPGQRRSRIRVERGAAELHAGTETVEFATANGTATLERGSRVQLSANDDGDDFVVLIGRVVISHDAGNTVAESGQSIRWDAGVAYVTTATAASDAETTPQEDVAPAPVANTSDAEIPVEDAASAPAQPPPGTIDLRTVAESSSIADVALPETRTVGPIHSATTPVAVRIPFQGRCAGGGVVSLPTARNASPVRGQSTAVIAVPAGNHRWELRCIENNTVLRTPALTGAVRVLRDAGTAVLPRRAPTNTVELDGQRWTLQYSNQLPEVTFRWLAAPSAPVYVLTVQPEEGRARVLRTSRPQLVLPSGQLSEGSYRVFFEAGGQRTRDTTVLIRFDNAAPAAQLREPRPGSVLSGTIHVAGVALPGSRVRALGNDLAVDSQGRFQGDVTLGPNQHALVVEVTHPSQGTHYYVRPSGDAP